MMHSIKNIKNICLRIIIIVISAIIIMFRTSGWFQVDSESLVVDPILADINDVGGDWGGWNLGFVHPNSEENNSHYYTSILKNDSEMIREYSFDPYTSQIGLQGWVFTFTAKIFSTVNIIKYLRLICCILFILTALLIAKQLYIKYNSLFAIIFYGVIMLSPWIADFAPNLYWVIFIWFIPILLGLLCLNYENKRKVIYPFFFLTIFVKSLCGYEYLSTIMISAEMFLFSEYIINRNTRKCTLKCIVLSSLCMLLGFFSAAFIHIIKLSEESLSQGFHFFIHNLIERRTYGNASGFGIEIKESLSASVWDVINLYFNSDFYGNLMKWVFVLALICLIIRKLIDKKDCIFLLSLLLLGFVSTISWLVLAKGHSYIHTHINFILFDMGYSWISIYCILYCVIDHFRKVKDDKM